MAGKKNCNGHIRACTPTQITLIGGYFDICINESTKITKELKEGGGNQINIHDLFLSQFQK